MPIQPSRRAVTIGLTSVSLLPKIALAGSQPLAGMWRAACLATEQAWIDEAAAIERIAAQGVEHTNDRWHDGALWFWRLAEERARACFEASKLSAADIRDRMPFARWYMGPDRSWLDYCSRDLAMHEALAARWRELADQEDLVGHTRCVDAAEKAEAVLEDAILSRPVVTDADRELRNEVAVRTAGTPTIERVGAGLRLSALLGDGRVGAAVSGRLTAPIIVRRLEALGYSLLSGDRVTLYDPEMHPETDEMRRRRARLIACGRSVPNLVADAVHFRQEARFEEADWWMGPRPVPG